MVFWFSLFLKPAFGKTVYYEGKGQGHFFYEYQTCEKFIKYFLPDGETPPGNLEKNKLGPDISINFIKCSLEGNWENPFKITFGLTANYLISSKMAFTPVCVNEEEKYFYEQGLFNGFLFNNWMDRKSFLNACQLNPKECKNYPGKYFCEGFFELDDFGKPKREIK